VAAGIAARAMSRVYARAQELTFWGLVLRLGPNDLCISRKIFAISFALLASSCPFVVEGRHEIGVREACVDKGGHFLTNQPEGHRKSLPDFLTVEEAADVFGIASLRGVTKSAFGTGVFGESDDEQA
jgi:hypothetical protein